jgi:NADPH:quinone reductase-like Zn-dependent oxidoreductase
MKAAVMFQKGELPQYTDFPEPIVHGDNELLISVKAAAIKHIDKSRASGEHYSTKIERLWDMDVPDGKRLVLTI